MTHTYIDGQCDLPMFNAARAARETGLEAGERCQAKAVAGGFDPVAARVVVMETLARTGRPMTGEELVDACIAVGLKPHDARAFGPVIAALSKAGKIEAVGFATRHKGHGTAGARLWRVKDGR